MSSQGWRTIRLPRDEWERVKEFLQKEGLSPAQEDFSLWAFKGENVKAVLFKSGALLLQGKGSDRIAQGILDQIKPLKVCEAGCDEAGKGDLFGPLVLCCAVISPENYKEVLSLTPRDSKDLKRDKVLKLSEELKKIVFYKCISLYPDRFNELWKETGSINKIMDRAYRRLIEEIRKSARDCEIFVDRYSSKNPFEDMRGVHFVERGEERVSISVASILAKAKFLKGLEKLKEVYRVEVVPGSSKEAYDLARSIPEDIRKKVTKAFYGIR